ncbi:hypothetical protein EPI10_022092 [Gossypium australe]|uniref:Uncharacterized protein n=1 Tax=Gossypium australe TaxID=47621 RepID=A0A5B6WIM2_9ROSI|nr:hypothetical protein EPI10_022092 [Gossypium australe]
MVGRASILCLYKWPSRPGSLIHAMTMFGYALEGSNSIDQGCTVKYWPKIVQGPSARALFTVWLVLKFY